MRKFNDYLPDITYIVKRELFDHIVKMHEFQSLRLILILTAFFSGKNNFLAYAVCDSSEASCSYMKDI